ncbi:hypothetical protein J132_03529 [Termitomyces sp. J132]|nr:hypothetical protein H2248_009657 [Termitomyces sp. 'cryptogamus']KNZ75319.1 hypothetical protein J132_03529 [Termitomyces sp. J132]
MRSTAARLVRLVPRQSLPENVRERVIPPPISQHLEVKRQSSLIDALEKLKADTGKKKWPANIRLEPVVKREAFKTVQADVRVRLKKLLKER